MTLTDTWTHDDEPGIEVAHAGPLIIGDRLLTARQRQLRDGEPDGPSIHTTARRQTRIARLEAKHADTMSLLGELDRYRQHAESAPCSPDVVRGMDRRIAAFIVEVRDHADHLHRSLEQLRRSAR